MGVTPTQLGSGVQIGWTVPKEISSRTDIDQIKVYRSSSIDSSYSLLDTISAKSGSDFVTTYNDTTVGAGRNMYYLVTFCAVVPEYESSFQITFFSLLPSEAYLVDEVKKAMPPVVQGYLTDSDYLSGLNLAVQIFNNYPPQTYFTLATFPRSHVAFLVGLAQMLALASRFLVISIRDFRYSEPGGVVMDIDRGGKINDAIQIISKVYTQILPVAKFDFAADLPMALGSVQLPLSMGGVVSRGLLNVLDIFTAVGR